MLVRAPKVGPQTGLVSIAEGVEKSDESSKGSVSKFDAQLVLDHLSLSS